MRGSLFSASTTPPRAWLGSASSAALAANFSHVQLFNKIADDIVLEVTKIIVTMDAVGAPTLRENGFAALTTLLGNGRPKALHVNSSTGGELRAQTAGALIGNEIERCGLPANGTYTFDFTADPLILPPSFGVIVAPSAVNLAIWAGFEWRTHPL